MLYLDLTHTSHTGAQTGIQRVCRRLYETTALRAELATAAVTYDPYRRVWRFLNARETGRLRPGADGGTHRKASWAARDKLLGTLANRLRLPQPPLPAGSSLIVPELYGPAVSAALPSLLARVNGPRVALFHDAIALKLPPLSAPATVSLFPSYLHGLARFDGIAAISADSRETLLDYWRWAGCENTPPVVAMPLGIDIPATTAPGNTETAASPPVVLSVGTLEGRKNHLSLLAACETLWAQGLDFELHLIGLTQPKTGRAAAGQLQRLQADGRPLFYHGAVDDAFLNKAYASCTFTVYPSLMEGFGLPVLESLARGKPCVCLDRGALGESALGGGCLTLPDVTPPTLANAIRKLLTAPATLQRLQAEARARHFRTWADYTDDLLGWMGTLTRRPS